MWPSLPSVVIIGLVEVEVWSFLILNVRRKTYMVILLESVPVQLRRLFWHISYYKVRQINFITKSDRLLLQSASGITDFDRLYYKVRQVLKSATVVKKWDVTTSQVQQTWEHGSTWKINRKM